MDVAGEQALSKQKSTSSQVEQSACGRQTVGIDCESQSQSTDILGQRETNFHHYQRLYRLHQLHSLWLSRHPTSGTRQRDRHGVEVQHLFCSTGSHTGRRSQSANRWSTASTRSTSHPTQSQTSNKMTTWRKGCGHLMLLIKCFWYTRG